MTDFNKHKYVPSTPKIYQVVELKEQSIKQANLSPAARSKIIKRSGSNYVSENRESYGPCLTTLYGGDCSCNFAITAILIDTNGNQRNDTINQPTFLGEGSLAHFKTAIIMGSGV